MIFLFALIFAKFLLNLIILISIFKLLFALQVAVIPLIMECLFYGLIYFFPSLEETFIVIQTASLVLTLYKIKVGWKGIVHCWKIKDKTWHIV